MFRVLSAGGPYLDYLFLSGGFIILVDGLGLIIIYGYYYFFIPTVVTGA
jgi:hypothetical protein